ncbi:MAG TPA: trypsin-like peptidase domain-containing protein, partial [Fimbriimonadaceae bacterium]|nr:trypsin-like peptidase domain-containing protein [Fimbriimonadaceae bacterium]
NRSSDVLGRRMGVVGGEGTGVIYRADGWILTNDHVVGGFEKVTVVLHDGRELPGEVRRAEDSDLAVVKVKAAGLTPAVFGDSNTVKPGQFAMAIGSPFGFDNTVTIGHISAVGRDTTIPDARVELGGRYYADLIQTDTSINMGNSGGPLVNIEGQVVGINSAIYSGTGGNVGIGFAIPSNQARLIADMLIEKGKITRGALGLKPENLKEYRKKELGLNGGAAIGEVVPGGPADKAGLKKDDIILKIAGNEVKNQLDVRNAMLQHSPGSTVDIELLRSGQRKTVTVKLVDPKQVRALTPTPPQPKMPQNFQFGTPDELEKYFQMPRPKVEDRDEAPLREGKARLGVGVENLTDTLRKQYSIPADVVGAVVVTVDSGSLAEQLGIEPGFVIQQLGNKKVRSAKDLSEAMASVNWGETRKLVFGKFSQNSQMSQSLDVTFR